MVFLQEFVISKSLWLILLATFMGLIRLFSRQIVFGIGKEGGSKSSSETFRSFANSRP